MARAARMIGDGGVIGWLAPETIAFTDEAQPTLATIQVSYKGSDIAQDSFGFNWMTTATQAEIRSLAKDAIRADILAKLGVSVPKANIKMLNSPE